MSLSYPCSTVLYVNVDNNLNETTLTFLSQSLYTWQFRLKKREIIHFVHVKTLIILLKKNYTYDKNIDEDSSELED